MSRSRRAPYVTWCCCKSSVRTACKRLHNRAWRRHNTVALKSLQEERLYHRFKSFYHPWTLPGDGLHRSDNPLDGWK